MNVFNDLFRKEDDLLEIATIDTAADKLVFGKLYASWCGHCKRLDRIWPNIIQAIKASNEKLVVLSIESENMDQEVEKVNSSILKDSPNKLALQEGYPTIFKIDKGHLSYYNGPREVDPMVAWCLVNNGKRLHKRKSFKRKSNRQRRKTNRRKSLRNNRRR